VSRHVHWLGFKHTLSAAEPRSSVALHPLGDTPLCVCGAGLSSGLAVGHMGWGKQPIEHTHIQQGCVDTHPYPYNLAFAGSCGELARYMCCYRSSLLSLRAGFGWLGYRRVGGVSFDSLSGHRHVAGCCVWAAAASRGSGRRMAATSVLVAVLDRRTQLLGVCVAGSGLLPQVPSQ
jgi:hypothetical protein